MRNASLSAGVIALAFAGYMLSGRKQWQGPQAPPTGKLLETKPVMSHKMFTGKAATAYKIAAEIPKIIDSQFCYCYCKRDHGHKTLLTCFTTLHGSKCAICMGEVIYAYRLYREKANLDEIVVAVEEEFHRPYRKHKASL